MEVKRDNLLPDVISIWGKEYEVKIGLDSILFGSIHEILISKLLIYLGQNLVSKQKNEMEEDQEGFQGPQ